MDILDDAFDDFLGVSSTDHKHPKIDSFLDSPLLKDENYMNAIVVSVATKNPKKTCIYVTVASPSPKKVKSIGGKLFNGDSPDL